MYLRSTLSLALVLVLSTPLVFAQQPIGPPPPSPPGPMRHHMDRGMSDGMHPDFRIAPPGMWWKNTDLVSKLNITADQQKRMDDIFQKSRLDLIDLKAALEKEEVTLQPMLAENPPDTNKVLAQIDRIAHARADLERANARMLLGIRGVLSPDQWTKLQTEDREGRHRIITMRRRFQYHDGHGGPRAPDGPGPAPAPPSNP